MPIDSTETLALLRELVSIDSVNPSLVPGARGEAAVAEHLCRWLQQRGIAANQQLAAPGRPNVVATLGPVEALQPALLIIGHIDTVGAGDMPAPFASREREGRLYGRGALDVKSGVAAMCAAAASVAREKLPLRRPCVIAGVVDEECNSIGTQTLLKDCRADAAVVLEPTGLQLVIAHKGYIWFEITTHGRAAHGSLPDEGRDAIRMMGRVLESLDQIDRTLAFRHPHPLLGAPSLHASLIAGGHELSSYPAECRLKLERRTIPGESDASLEAELSGMLDQLCRSDPHFLASLRTILSRQPYSIEENAAIALAAAEAIRQVTGAVEFSGMPYWTDTALLWEAGISGVVIGPSGSGLHGPEEYVELDSVVVCAQVLETLIRSLCG